MPTHPLHEPVLRWYADHARDLPWRGHDTTPWGVVVSEVMLQQTPVARVLPVWLRWMERWPGPADLAAESPGEAVRAWDRLGYPRRALRLHDAATAIVAHHDGVVPQDLTALRSLPGVGEYTAAAVASFAFGQSHAVVDTNVRRVQARTVTGVAVPAAALTRAETELARDLVPDDDAPRWAVAVMELGAVVCTARSPRCELCPVARMCAWRLAGSPPHDGPARRGQTWAGTDRRVRGLILAALRESRGPVSATDLARRCPDEELADPSQRSRCLDTLIADGLVEPVGAPGARSAYGLPS